jgi:multiple sugar transport system permease protein
VALAACTLLLLPLLLLVREWRSMIPVLFLPGTASAALARHSLNGVVLSLAVAAVCVLAAPGAGHALSLRRLPFRRFWIVLLAAAAIMPVTLLLVPGEIVFAAVNLRDSLWGVGLIEIALALPVSVWIMKNAFDRIPPDLLEAARFEGATPFRTYRIVALPLVRSAQAITFLVALAMAWGEYVVSSTLLARPSIQTTSAALASAARAGVPWVHLAPQMLICAFPGVLLIAVAQLHLARWTGLERFLEEWQSGD